jgi:hypothetical protein
MLLACDGMWEGVRQFKMGKEKTCERLRELSPCCIRSNRFKPTVSERYSEASLSWVDSNGAPIELHLAALAESTKNPAMSSHRRPPFVQVM